MIEKVNPCHPDKVADRIAGAIVDATYKLNSNPRTAVEVLIGHGICTIEVETDTRVPRKVVRGIVKRICGRRMLLIYRVVQQDRHLAKNQQEGLKCGDNGIFKGVPMTDEDMDLSCLARKIYFNHPTDGKYILDGERLIVCQSNATTEELRTLLPDYPNAEINPLGYWTGGTDVDCGATNRKLGSDMAQSVMGGGLHGKDLSKADVSVNIYAWKRAQETNKVQQFCCAIGDTEIDGKPYAEIVQEARDYIEQLGGFERFAEWGLF